MKKPLIGVTPSLDQETKDSTCRPTYLVGSHPSCRRNPGDPSFKG